MKTGKILVLGAALGSVTTASQAQEAPFEERPVDRTFSSFMRKNFKANDSYVKKSLSDNGCVFIGEQKDGTQENRSGFTSNLGYIIVRQQESQTQIFTSDYKYTMSTDNEGWEHISIENKQQEKMSYIKMGDKYFPEKTPESINFNPFEAKTMIDKAIIYHNQLVNDALSNNKMREIIELGTSNKATTLDLNLADFHHNHR